MIDFQPTTKEEQEEQQPPAAAQTEPETEPEGEAEEAIEWDGSEAELVLDDDAAEYEEPQTGIKLSYVLREEEVFRALEKSGFSKTMGRRAILECVLFAALAVLFFARFFASHEGANLFFGIVAVLALLLAALLPVFGRKRRARLICADERLSNIELEIYPDGIQIGSGDGEWEIPFDGTCRRVEHRGLLLLFPAGKRHMLILPLRCVEPGVLAEVQAMVVSGTYREDES